MPGAPNQIDQPELGSIQISLPTVGIQYDRFLAYELDQHFLMPSDLFWFDLDQDELADASIKALVPGTKVEVRIDGNLQVTGYVDEAEVQTGPGGTVIHVECRDWLSPAVDSQVDPQLRFTASMSLQNLLDGVFDQFNVGTFSIDNLANRNVITGRIYGAKSSKKGKVLKSYTLHETKPYPNEGAFAFAARVCQRFGLWIWPSAIPGTVVVGKPDFDQDVSYEIRHVVGDAVTAAKNNVISGRVKPSRRNQPAAIVGYGVGGGGEFARTSLRSLMINPLLAVDVSGVKAAYPDLKAVPFPGTVVATPFPDPNARVLYLYDPESHTQDQLDAFVLREMSLRLREIFSAEYVIEGHKLGGFPIAVDTIAAVEDDRSNVHQNLWVIGRRFSKHAGSGGTHTTVKLILPNSMVF
jgi:prophage tail gpP-like protein